MGGFHDFLARRLGDPRHPVRFLPNLFVVPLCARSIADFWRLRNPIFGYVLLFGIHRPLRRGLPRPVAVYLSFLGSGFLLQDLPFSIGADLCRGRPAFPKVTLLFAIFGALAPLGEALGIDISRSPPPGRAASNLCWLSAGNGLRHASLLLLHVA